MHLLFDLQQANEIAQDFSGRLQPEEIAHCVTDGLVERFGCAFARLWLVEPDQTALKLVASSGMYTNLNGFFGRVPMGAFKVGKIAQNRVSFLSNNLSAEAWVGNREWAIANNIRGFAGYPLIAKDRVIGVLAAFSHTAMASEFLEVLRTLCSIATIALDTALHYQREKQIWQSVHHSLTFNQLALSDQLASILSVARFTLVGTERSLTLPSIYLFLQAATTFQDIGCTYGRLIYADDAVALEVIIASTVTSTDSALVPENSPVPTSPNCIHTRLGAVSFTVSCLGGVLETQTSENQRSIQVVLKVPYQHEPSSDRLRIQCRSPVLQLAFTHLAFQAGLTVWTEADETIALLTDDITQVQPNKRVLWIQQGTQALPKGVQAKLTLDTSADQLRQAVKTIMQGKVWGIDSEIEVQQIFSERELEILKLLTQGHRDRDIADRLIISESTVKFHMNNVLSKLKVRTRYQAIHQAIVNGWI